MPALPPPSVLELRFEWPRRLQPLYLIVDDPAPCLNLAHYEQYWERHERNVPNSFTAAWADLIEEFDVRGKFSVLPVPAGLGRIDRPLPDVRPADQEEFLRLVRERIGPRMSVGIEFLTHFLAWDLKRERPVDYTEKCMGPHTNREHLTHYFVYGLRILHELGLNPGGATSPGPACREIEWAYQAAIRDAVRAVTGSPVAWYFLHVDDRSPVVLPAVRSLDARRGEACIHLPSAGNDPSWRTQCGEPSTLDALLTADGQGGRLADLYRNGGPVAFHTHWQSLFSEGRATGLRDFRELFRRIREHLTRARWITFHDLARVVAAQAATTATVTPVNGGTGVAVTLAGSIACPEFTVSLGLARQAVRLTVDGHKLRQVSAGTPLEAGSWQQLPGGVAWCADLPADACEVVISLDAP